MPWRRRFPSQEWQPHESRAFRAWLISIAAAFAVSMIGTYGPNVRIDRSGDSTITLTPGPIRWQVIAISAAVAFAGGIIILRRGSREIRNKFFLASLFFAFVWAKFAYEARHERVVVTPDAFEAPTHRFPINGPLRHFAFDKLRSLTWVEHRGRSTTLYQICDLKSGEIVEIDLGSVREDAWREITTAARAHGVEIRRRS